MKSRRLLLAATACLALAPSLAIAATAASTTAASCGMSPARRAFDVEGLKSELMVTALSCSQQDRYNEFMAKFRPAVAGEEETLTRYFSGTYGRAAQREHDAYITQLANIQSERGLQAGTQFCDQRVSMFDEVAVLDDVSDLGAYAEAKDIVQPGSYDMCQPPAAPEPSRGSSHRRARTRHRG